MKFTMDSSVMVTLSIVLLSVFGSVQPSCTLVCSPGEFLSPSQCNCLPCPNNTFNDKENNSSKCRPCKKRCEPSMIVNRTCTKTHDTICTCKEGKYRDPEILFCVDCAVCPAGSGATKPCSTNSNTICSPCITGKNYSSSMTQTKPCTPCTVCPSGYSIRQNCTNTTDTVCHIIIRVTNGTQKPMTGTRTFKVPVSSTNESSSLTLARKKEDVLVPVLAVVIVFLIFLSIVGVIILYKRCARNRIPPVPRNDSEDGREVYPLRKTTISQSKLRHGGLRGRRTRHLRRGDNGRESPDSQDSTGSLQEKPRDPERLLRELPNDTLIIENLAMLLNPKGRNNWVRLAGELGYSRYKVDNFKIDSSNATQSLLTDWRTTNSSTLGKLYGCLRKMKRDDACEVLENV